MKLFGITIGKAAGKNSQESASASNRELLKRISRFYVRFEIIIVTIAVGVLLAYTSLKMYGYTDPPLDEERAAENITKLKRVNLDPEDIERIRQLSDSQTTTSPNLQDNRKNPFSE